MHTGCVLFYWTDIMTANHYYSTSRVRRSPIWEGEIIIYDVTALNENIIQYRGYNTDYIEKFIELFRVLDGCKYYTKVHGDIYRKIKKQIRDERFTLR